MDSNTIVVLCCLFSALAVMCGVGILFSKNIFKAVLLLLGCLLALAGIYVLQFAEFVAVVQILVYAGGVIVLIIFAIMLMEKRTGRPFLVTHRNVFSAALLSLATFSVLTMAIAETEWKLPSGARSSPGMESIGKWLMTSHALPFEAAGVLLIVALVGASVIASSNKSS